MNKKRIFAIVLFLFLGFFIYTMANPKEEQAGNFSGNDGKSNVNIIDKDIDNSTTTDNNGATTINSKDNNQRVEQTNQIIPVVKIVDTSKLEEAINNGSNLVNNSKTTTDESLKQLLVKLEDLIEEGKNLLGNDNKTQDEVDNKAEEINKIIEEINNKLDDLYQEAQEAVDKQKTENTKENIDDALDKVNKLPDGEKKQELLDQIKDITAPIGVVTTSNDKKPTNKNVTATLTVNEEIFDLSGWTKVDNNTYTREYEVNGAFQVTITDLNGNISVVDYEVAGIDKVAPVITGVEDGITYENSATAIITDENLDTVTLNGNEYVSGTKINEAGSYTLIAKDTAGNTTTVKFQVEKRYTVTFKDYKGVISTQTVTSSSELNIPTVTGYTSKNVTYVFAKWDQDLTTITSDLTVNALYDIAEIETSVYNLLIDTIPENGAYTGKASDYSLLKKVSLKLSDDILTVTKANRETTLVLGNENVLNYVEDVNSLPEAAIGYEYNWYVLRYEPADGWHIDGKQEQLMYTVTFKDQNTIISTQKVAYGNDAVLPTNPVRQNTKQYTYEFIGWDKEATNVTSDLTVNAIFKMTLNKYKVTFMNDGVVYNEQEVEYGKSAIAPTNPTKPATKQYTYEFTGWDQDFSNITDDLTVNATYSEKTRTYKVTFMNGNAIHNEQEVKYGESAVTPLEPSKLATKQYTYEFAGWDKDYSNITEDLTVNAKFNQTTNKYTVTFVTNLGTTINTQQVEYGKNAIIPNYSKEIYMNNVKYVYVSMTNNYTNITESTTVTLTYRLANKSTFKAYLLYDIYTRPEDGDPDSSLKYHRVKKSSKLEIVDDSNGSLARVVREANNSKTKEAVLALGMDEINKYLTNETKRELATLNGKDLLGRKYKIDWYVLKYNAKDNTWHLDGEKIYY